MKEYLIGNNFFKSNFAQHYTYAKDVVLYNKHNPTTTTNEILHALGLYHTFSAGANYTYKKGETNIMDYSHWPIYGSKNRMLTWLWQWKKIRTNGLVKQE